MWNYSKEEWNKEVQVSLKSQVPAEFLKLVFVGGTVSPFGGLESYSPFQIPATHSFLSIQNYSDLKNAKMDEWLQQKDIGLRFRELNDSLEQSIQNKDIFLSQPFPYLLSEAQAQGVCQLLEKGNRLNLGWSPLSFGLTRGEILKRPFNHWESFFAIETLKDPAIDWFYLSSAPYQWAGAEPHVEVAIVVSLAYAILKEMEACHISPEMAASKMTFGLALGTDVLTESSKVVALRRVWARLREVLFASQAATSKIYVLPSLRYFSGRDPWNNILRTTLMSFSAIVGGADGFKCIPYDVLAKKKSPEAIRISTNIPLLLQKEGYLSKVENVMDGASLFTESTEKICEAAWTHFQEIEKKGGIFEAVRSGWLQTELKRSAEYSKNQMSYMQKEYVGINKYVVKKSPQEDVSARDLVKLNDIIDPLFLTKSAEDYVTVEPLVVSSLSYDWERLQMSSDQFFKSQGNYPQVVVVRGGGPVVEKKISWLTNLLNVGVIEVKTYSFEDIDKIKDDELLIILIPSQDEMEESMCTQLRKKFKAKIWSMNHHKTSTTIEKFFSQEVNALELIKDIHAIVAVL